MKPSLRRLSRYAAVLTVLLCGTVPAAAQTIDGQFATQVNPGAGTAGSDQLQVTLRLEPSSGFDLGTSTLMFTFNDGALSLPSNPAVNDPLQAGTDYAYRDPYVNDPGGGKFYVSSTVTRFAANRLSVNIVLDLANVGQAVPATPTPVVDIFFDIDDASETASLAWVLAPDPNPTVVQREDNTTALTNGTFMNSDVNLPVELVAFRAVVEGKAVVLRWETASETNNAGFDVEHRRASEGAWNGLGFIEGRGTSSQAQVYTYRTAGLDPGRHVFRLKQVDLDGAFAYSPEVEVTVALAEAFVLEPAYPNPFGAAPATIRFGVREARPVQLDLYDATGRWLHTLYRGTPEAGRLVEVRLDGGALASGTYFVRLVSEHLQATQQVLFVK